MEYRVTINDITYDLPKKTVDITDSIEAVEAVMEDHTISAEIRFSKMYEFIASMIGIGKTRSIMGSNIAKCDTNEIWIIAQSIIDVYASPIKRYKAQKKAEDLERSPLGKLMAHNNA